MFKPSIPTKYPESFEKAYEYAVYLLSLHLRTEGELREKLRIKNYESRITDRVIDQLTQNRYVDDERYAEIFVDNLKKYKTFGFYGIKKKLMEKRLPSNIIESVLEEALSEEEEMKIAKRLLKKQELRIKNQEEKQKLARKLASRGFRSNIVSKFLSAT